MDSHELHGVLRRARRRQWTQTIVRHGAAGLAAGSAAGLLIGAISLLWPIAVVEWWIGSAVLLGLAGGVAIGLSRRPSLPRTALAVDEAARLKDRVHSALQFSSEPAADAYRELQVNDAVRALRRDMVPGLFPWRWPREGTWAVFGIALVLFATMLLPTPEPATATITGPPPAVQIETAELTEALEAFEQLGEELSSEELEKLARQLREMVGELDTGAETTEEAILQLARMSAAIEAAAAPFDSLLLEQAMRNVGEGMSALDGFNPAAEMLKQGEYEQAAEMLDRFGLRIGTGEQPVPSTGGLLKARLGQLAEQAGSAGLSELGEGLTALQQAVKRGSQSECESACKRLGATVGKYARRVKVGRAMRSQLGRLSQAKKKLSKKGGYCKACRSGCGPCKGGKCKGMGVKIGLPTLKFARSDSPNQRAGTAAAMNLFDKETDLDGRRVEEQVTGRTGHGPSETETESSLEAEEAAARSYREVYAKYRKLSEAVMTEEAVPLGHRQIIKRYFELIHPDRLEAEGLLRDVPEAPAPVRTTGQEEPSE